MDLIFSCGYLCFTIRQKSIWYKMVFFLNFMELADVANKEILFSASHYKVIFHHLIHFCVEIMIQMIRQNNIIGGIKIGKKKYVIYNMLMIQFFILMGQKKSLKAALDLLYQFSKLSDLKPNISKINAIWIGSKINTQTHFLMTREYTGLLNFQHVEYNTFNKLMQHCATEFWWDIVNSPEKK